MIVLAFTIKGPGVPKGRPRFTRQGRAYTPKVTENFEKWVRANAKQTMMRNSVRMIESGAVSIKIMFRFAPPASWSNKRRQAAIAARAPKITKTDLDNLVKADINAMNPQEKKYFQLGLIEGQIERKEELAAVHKGSPKAGVSA